MANNCFVLEPPSGEWRNCNQTYFLHEVQPGIPLPGCCLVVTDPLLLSKVGNFSTFDVMMQAPTNQHNSSLIGCWLQTNLRRQRTSSSTRESGKKLVSWFSCRHAETEPTSLMKAEQNRSTHGGFHGNKSSSAPPPAGGPAHTVVSQFM